MENDIKSIITEIDRVDIFDLKIYYDYVDKYGKDLMLKVFNYMLVNSSDVNLVCDKYFDVYYN